MLSERLIFLRKQHRISQKNVAEQIEISIREYQRYEYGQREPTASTIIALAKFYGVSADYLLGLTDKPEPWE